MATLFSDNFNRADNLTVDATNWVETPGINWQIVGNALQADVGTPPGFCITTTSAHAAVADCQVSVTRASAGFVAGLCVRASNSSVANGYIVWIYGSNNVDVVRMNAGVETVLATRNVTHANGDTYKFQVSGTGSTVTLKFFRNGSQVGADVTDSSASRITAAGQTGLSDGGGGPHLFDTYLVEDIAVAAATLSSPTPSGTLGTQTTATIGATTDQSSGTLYVVVDSAANLSGVTASQIKAGQKASGSAALASNNAAVSTTSPSAGVTGLTAATAYGYAIVQNNANGDSNVVTGTFTTANPPASASGDIGTATSAAPASAASSTRSVSITLRNNAGNPLVSVARRFWTRTTLDAAAADGGAGGLSFTCNGVGLFTLTGLTVLAGPGWLTYKDPSDDLNCHTVPVTFS